MCIRDSHATRWCTYQNSSPSQDWPTRTSVYVLSPHFSVPTPCVVTQTPESQLLSKLCSLHIQFPPVSRRGIGIWLLESGVIVALWHLMMHCVTSCHITIVIAWSLRTNLVLRTKTLARTYREELTNLILLPWHHSPISITPKLDETTYGQSIQSTNCDLTQASTLGSRTWF